MTNPIHPAAALSRRDLRPAPTSVTTPSAAAPAPTTAQGVDQDAAVEFLRSIAPPSPAERTRAFAALLRALTAEAGR